MKLLVALFSFVKHRKKLSSRAESLQGFLLTSLLKEVHSVSGCIAPSCSPFSHLVHTTVLVQLFLRFRKPRSEELTVAC